MLRGVLGWPRAGEGELRVPVRSRVQNGVRLAIRMMERAGAYPPLPAPRVDLAATVPSSAAFATVSDAIGGKGHTALTLISHNT